MTTQQVQQDPALLRLLAGRARAVEKQPYLATALFAMKPVRCENQGLATLGVDKRWRMYWNPVFVEQCTVDEAAACWSHEVGHLLRSHAHRFEALLEPQTRAKIFNIAGDAAINDDLRDANLILPLNLISPIFPETIPGGEKGMTAEQFYRLILKHHEDEGTCPDCGLPTDGSADPQPGAGQDSQRGDGDQPGDGAGDGDQPGDGAGDGDQPGDGAGDGDQPGDGAGDGDQPGDGAGEGDQPGDGAGDGDQPGDGAGDGDQPGDGAGDGDQPGDGAGQGSQPGDGAGQGNQPGDGAGQGSQPGAGQGSSMGHRCPAHYHGPGSEQGNDDCGSGAGGSRRAWEDDSDGPADDGSVDEGRGNLIREQVAREIHEHSKNRGTVPGGWVRWSETILKPQVDWRRELNSVVSRTCAAIAGMKDYSYQRPSRRASSVPNVVLPSMRAPRPPKVAVVVDTSGSVSDIMLGQALGDIKDLMARVTAAGGTGIELIACDAAAADMQSVRSIQHVNLSGGGGTDMRVGIEAAAAMRPMMDLIITMTDGYTPWPDSPPTTNPRAKYVAVLLNGDDAVEDVPDFIHSIAVDDAYLRRMAG